MRKPYKFNTPRAMRPPKSRVEWDALIARLLAGVVIEGLAPGGCWIWRRSTDADGYPRIKVAGKVQWAHRVSYALFCEPIRRGFQIDHKCVTSGCINPAHLQPVTNTENTRLRDARRIALLPPMVLHDTGLGW